MYTEHFKKRLFSSTWRISVAHGMIHMKLHVACLNVILNIGAYYHRVDKFVLVVFAVGPLLQLALVTTSPMLLRVNSGMLNVIRIVTYYTLPPLKSPTSSWIAMAYSR